jgi:hypothetical protein
MPDRATLEPSEPISASTSLAYVDIGGDASVVIGVVGDDSAVEVARTALGVAILCVTALALSTLYRDIRIARVFGFNKNTYLLT